MEDEGQEAREGEQENRRRKMMNRGSVMSGEIYSNSITVWMHVLLYAVYTVFSPLGALLFSKLPSTPAAMDIN